MDPVAIALESGDFATALPYIESLSKTELSQLSLPGQRTPLHYACQHGRIDAVQRLIAKYCSIDESENTQLVAKYHSIEVKDDGKNTPLNTAVQYGQLEMVKYLLRYMFIGEAHEILLEVISCQKLFRLS